MNEIRIAREESVLEDRQRVGGHEEYETLCALAAGGLLQGTELAEVQAHVKNCNQCRSEYEKLSALVTRELPLGEGGFRQKLAEMRAQPLPGSRQRFLRRARAEGVVFSDAVNRPAQSGSWWSFRPPALLATAAAMVLIAIGLAVYHSRGSGDSAQAGAAAQQIAELKRQNETLSSSLAQSTQKLTTQQHDIQNLRIQLAEAARNVENLPRSSDLARGQTARWSSENAQLMDEARNQQKLLASAQDEAARSSQLRLNDEAALVEQQARITELSNKLRIASATLDMERQLAAAGKDVRELMAARELHVIDVRETDPNGKLTDAFGRVFLTEGKSLTFYAFDLNQSPALNAKRSFQVWAVADSASGSSRSLGFLHADGKAPGRWVLNVDNPELVSQIHAVFVTSEPGIGGKEPSTQKLLYAYLGEPNHP
jgi:hypothetical protein